MFVANLFWQEIKNPVNDRFTGFKKYPGRDYVNRVFRYFPIY